jgi:putative aldouronate transport system substrate-binding protein
MKKLSIRISASVLLAAMTVTLFAGCDLKTENATNNETIKATGEPVELTVEVFDRSIEGYQADNNFQTKWIRENFGTPNNINIKFVPVPRWEENQKFNLLMASNQVPDICMTYDQNTIANYVKSDQLTDLGPLLKEYAPNLVNYLGQTLLDYGKFKGVQMAVPSKRVIEGCFAAYIRKDWLEKLGLSVPTTTDEWYSVMKAFKEKDPGKLGDKNIPFAFQIDPKSINWTTSTLLESFKQKITEEERMSLPNWIVPGFKDGNKFLNKLYNEGVLNQNFALETDQYEKHITSGRVGFFINSYDQPLRADPSMLTKLKKNVPAAELVPCDPFTNYEGKHVKMKYNPCGLFIVVPKTSKRAIEAVKYLEWMTNPEVLKFLQNGVKGQQYTDEKNGIPMNFVPANQLDNDKKSNFIDLSIIVNGKEFGSQEKNIEAVAYAYTGYEEKFEEAYKISLADAGYYPHFEVMIESEGKYRDVLNEIGAQVFVSAISCKPEEFDSVYDSLVKKYMEAGGQQIVDEKLAALKASK